MQLGAFSDARQALTTAASQEPTTTRPLRALLRACRRLVRRNLPLLDQDEGLRCHACVLQVDRVGPAAFVWLALAVPLALKLCIVWRRRRKRAQERLRG